ncbi:hypothetical protein [Rhodococcus pyridinivorans]|uniref:hypothetical protein n=1 Tax=Rhodococcus pyridinivorans TaxID=103816 RepID=UPI0020789C57|nr:hypothetical protein [Rhodococcus pyridinivorans]USI91691.1 hypothetical protein LLA01_07355 [Rhodococcus pyridinivorans]
MTLTPAQLREVISSLPASLPITDEYEAGNSGKKVWYRSQKEHLQGWLAGYNGPGAYNRKTHTGTARDFYQRFRCVAGLLWLAEALGEDSQMLRGAVADVYASGSNPSSQCAAFRRRVPWARIEELLVEHDGTQGKRRWWSLPGNRRG